MKSELSDALNRIIEQIEAGESVEQCLARYRPEVAAQIRPMVELALALRALRPVPPPAPEAVVAQRSRFLERAAELRREKEYAPARRRGLWRQTWEWLSAPGLRNALVAASLTLVFGLLLLLGALHSEIWLPALSVQPSATFVAVRQDSPTPAPSLQPTPSATPTPTATPPPMESPTPAPPPTATPPAPATPLPIIPTTVPTSEILSPSPSPQSPTSVPPTATSVPTATRRPVATLVPPTPTASPTPVTPTWTPTEKPERPKATATPTRPTATPTRAPATATPTTELPKPTPTHTSTVAPTPTATRQPGPTLIPAGLTTPTVLPPR